MHTSGRRTDRQMLASYRGNRVKAIDQYATESDEEAVGDSHPLASYATDSDEESVGDSHPDKTPSETHAPAPTYDPPLAERNFRRAFGLPAEASPLDVERFNPTYASQVRPDSHRKSNLASYDIVPNSDVSFPPSFSNGARLRLDAESRPRSKAQLLATGDSSLSS